MVLESIGMWMADHLVASSVMVLIASFYLLVKSSDYIITGITGYSQKLGLSDYLIGFLVLGMGTSLPEFVSALMGNSMGEPGIVFGTILGSAVTTVTLVLGVLAIVVKKINLTDKRVTDVRHMIIPLCMLPLILVYDGGLSRIDGAILLAAFAVFVTLVWQKEGTFGRMKNDVKLRHIAKDGLIFILALMTLLLAARFLVFSSIVLSNYYHIPVYIIAVTVIAIGASVGDLALDMRSLLRGRRNIAIGNVLGGLVFENTLIIGLVALIHPVNADFKQLLPAGLFFFIPLAAIIALIKRGALERKHGIWLISAYVAFLVVQIFVMKN